MEVSADLQAAEPPHQGGLLTIIMRRLCIAVLAAAGVLFTPAAAWAHSELISSDPGYGDRLAAPPSEVRLEFSGAMDLTGARLTLHRKGSGQVDALRPKLASPDRRVVSVALPAGLPDRAYTMVWFFLGSDGHLMGGEVPFVIGTPAVAALPKAAAPGTPRAPREMQTLGPGIAGPGVQLEAVQPPAPVSNPRFAIAVATPQAVVRLLDYTSLAILIGGGFFLARVWTAGTGERRAHRLLWWALLGSAVATLLTFGLTAAGLRGVSALEALDPSVMGAVLGTRFSRVILARAAFLGLAFLALTMLTLGREQAVRSRWWRMLAGMAGGGVLLTHALLGHASSEGFAARLAVFVHLVGVAAWLGGLVFLGVVVLPRRRADELRALLPRFSTLAFTAVSAMVVAGAVMVLRVAPKVTELPQTGYGRMLLLKLLFVGLLLAAAQRARTFTERRLVKDATRLRPLVAAVGVELVLAVVILSSTSVLAGRVPPSTRTPTNAVSPLKGQR
jgi:copper transport protein